MSVEAWYKFYIRAKYLAVTYPVIALEQQCVFDDAAVLFSSPLLFYHKGEDVMKRVAKEHHGTKLWQLLEVGGEKKEMNEMMERFVFVVCLSFGSAARLDSDLNFLAVNDAPNC